MTENLRTRNTSKNKEKSANSKFLVNLFKGFKASNSIVSKLCEISSSKKIEPRILTPTRSSDPEIQRMLDEMRKS